MGDSDESKKSRGKRHGWGKVFYGLFLVVCLVVGTLFGWAKNSSLLMRGLTDPRLLIFSDPRKAFDGRDVEQILVLGCDEDRVYTGYHTSRIVRADARTDMMMIARLDFAHNTITGLSIPRDTECTLPGYSKHKINAYYSIAKPSDRAELTQKAVEHLLPGVAIDKVVAIDFDKFQELVNLVDGVDLTVPKKVDYDDYAGELHIHFKVGPQHLNGKNAIEYVRFRHDEDGDFGRQQRQRDFLLALKTSAIKNWTRLPAIAEQGKRVLGGAFSDDQVLALAMFSRKVPSDRIQMVTLPTVPGEGSNLKIDKTAAAKTLSELGLVSSRAPTAG